MSLTLFFQAILQNVSRPVACHRLFLSVQMPLRRRATRVCDSKARDLAGDEGERCTLAGRCLIAFRTFPSLLIGQLDESRLRRKFSLLPYRNGENANSVFCSAVASRGVPHAEDAGDARTEAAMGAKKSPRLVDVVVVVVAGVCASTAGALPTPVFRRPSSSAREEAAVPIALGASSEDRLFRCRQQD